MTTLIGVLNAGLPPFATGVLKEMSGWAFEWEPIQKVLENYTSSLYWLAIVLVAIFVLGTQLVFFPLFYRGMSQQAPGAMRLSYLMSLLVAIVVVHWWLWQVIFVALTGNYWIWLVWVVLILVWGGLVFVTPKRRLEP